MAVDATPELSLPARFAAPAPLAELIERFGRPQRYGISVETMVHRLDPAELSVRWPCGCDASGPSFRALRVAPCDRHRP